MKYWCFSPWIGLKEQWSLIWKEMSFHRSILTENHYIHICSWDSLLNLVVPSHVSSRYCCFNAFPHYFDKSLKMLPLVLWWYPLMLQYLSFFFSKKSVLHKHEESRQFELMSKEIQVLATRMHLFITNSIPPHSHILLNARKYFRFLENLNN